MRTRLAGLILTAVFLMVPAAAFAAPAMALTATDVIVATESFDEPPGLEPKLAEDGTEWAPEYIRPPMWWGSVVTLVPALGVIALLGALYWFQVERPRRKAAGH